MNNYKEIFEVMVNTTANYLKDNGLKTMVLGISGGIDSTVTAAICNEVAKRNPELRFIGVSLPCSTNNNDEVSSAESTLYAFCERRSTMNRSLQEEFSFIKNSFDEDYSWLGIEGSTKLAEGNIKARLRMMYLYNLASLTHGLVMDTDNLTEHYLGFWTIHGDVGDYNPIGGLWKHEVYGLAKWLANEFYDNTTDSEKIIALRKAIVIIPTDGNGVVAGGDMAQIAPGYTYEAVDDILITYLSAVGKHTDAYENEMYMLNCKYGAETVERVLKRHRNSEFKRKRLPIAIERSEYQKYIDND